MLIYLQSSYLNSCCSCIQLIWNPWGWAWRVIYFTQFRLFISKLLFFLPTLLPCRVWPEVNQHCASLLWLSFLFPTPGDPPTVSEPEESLCSGVPGGAGPSAHRRGTAWGDCPWGRRARRWGSRHKAGVEWCERSSGNEEISLGECQTASMVKASVPLSLLLGDATGKAQPKWTGCLG